MIEREAKNSRTKNFQAAFPMSCIQLSVQLKLRTLGLPNSLKKMWDTAFS